MKNVVRFFRLTVFVGTCAYAAFVLSVFTANQAVVRFSTLNDNRSHGWGEVFTISIFFFIYVVIVPILKKDRVYRRIVGDGPKKSTSARVSWKLMLG